MITRNRKTLLNWVLSSTAFEAINVKSLVALSRPLGTSVSAVNKMLSYGEEMKMLLPDILGSTPESTSSNWDSLVANYWHNFGIDVPQTGQSFDIGFNFDLTDYKREKHINALIESAKLKVKKAKKEDAKDGEEGFEDVLTTSDELEAIFADYVMTKIPEELKFRYGTPNNVADYLAWRYCLVSSAVANNPEIMVKAKGEGESEDVNKLKTDAVANPIMVSTRIQFFLIDEGDAAKQKAKLNNIRNEAIKKYVNLLTSKDSDSKIDNLLIADDRLGSIQDIKTTIRGDKEAMLMEIATTNPEKFIALLANTNISQVAEIKKFIMSGYLRQLPNTTIITDGTDPSVVLGNTINEVISYMASSVNAAYVNELKVKFNSLIR